MQNHPPLEETASLLLESQGPQLLTAAKLADLLSISVRTLRRLHASGKLPHSIRLGGSIRWRADIVQTWIEADCPPTKPTKSRRRIL